jgi:hypothetical protein
MLGLCSEASAIVRSVGAVPSSELLSRNATMKIAIQFGIAATLLVSALAHAQSAPQTAHQAGLAAQTATQINTADSTWVPPYGQPVAQKTRAQVYQELIQAENDGQLAYLDSVVYAHS